MTDSVDGIKRSVVWSNPVTAAGFAQLPMTVALRKDISLGAKMVYQMLGFIAWRGRGDPAMFQDELAEMMNIGKRTLQDYLRELREAPVLEGDGDEGATRLIEVNRRGLGLPNVYTINDPEAPLAAPRKREKGAVEAHDPRIPMRARGKAGKTEVLDAPTANAVVATQPPQKPPSLTKINGRNLGWDALAEVCEIDPDSPRNGEIAVALNGIRGRPGIRALFWIEAKRWSERMATFDPDEVEPERFETSLALMIRAKAGKYREKMPGAILTPTALAKWWLDLERMKSPDGGLTPEEMRNFLA